MTILIICILVYAVSFYGSYRWVKIAHSYGGVFYGVDTGISHFISTVIPLVNTVMCVILWVSYYPTEKEFNLNKFFNVKKHTNDK